MHRASEKHRIRRSGAGIMVVAVVALIAVAATNGSCLFRTETNLCKAFDRRCAPRQTCALKQDACIDIGGCGDGFTDRTKGEVCDDGNITDGDGDGCSADCKSNETCGNGIVDSATGESCDDNNATPGDGCDSHCVAEVCGDRIVNIEIGEVCDDGNIQSDDGCSATCKSNEACGNGIIDDDKPGGFLHEQCDPKSLFPLPAQDTPDCDSDCTLPTCGDKHLNRMNEVTSQRPNSSDHFEECDDGEDSPGCNFDCTLARCGDGYRNTAANEECDDGPNNNNINPDKCRTDCREAYCGDHVKDGGETCDTGVDTSECDSGDCTTPSCGDGYLNEMAGEECEPAIGCIDQTLTCPSTGNDKCKCI